MPKERAGTRRIDHENGEKGVEGGDRERKLGEGVCKGRSGYVTWR